MRILYVITGLGVGGAEKVVVLLAEKMKELGHLVKICYLTGESLVEPQYKEIELIKLQLNSKKDFFKASIKYRELIIDFKPDVIHSHMVHANIFTRVNNIFLREKIKLICSAHNSNEGGLLRMIAYRLTNNLSDYFTNVSVEASQSLVDKHAVKSSGIHTVYNGIDLKKFNNSNIINNNLKSEFGIEDETKIILAVGRLEDQKDYPNLLNSISILRSNNIRFKLLIVGEGYLNSFIELMISNLGLSGDVILLGKREDIPELMNIADVYVLSSKFEGLPTVLIEAMACGKFIVSTDCGGAREIMGDTGILVPIEDSEVLASALQKALMLPSHSIEINSINARKRAEQLFSIDKVINEWLKIYV